MTRSRLNPLHQAFALACLCAAAATLGCSGMSDARQPTEVGSTTSPSSTGATATAPTNQGVAGPAPGEAGAPKTDAASPTNAPPDRGKAPPPDSGPSLQAAASRVDPVGVPACDEYLARMAACLDRLDPAAKAATEKSFEQTANAWRAAAAQGAAAVDALRQGCAAAVAAIPPMCQ